MPRFIIKWEDRTDPVPCHVRHTPDKGLDVRTNLDGHACTAILPPAKRHGQHVVVCGVCNQRATAAANGWFDDPKSITMNCRHKRP